MAQTVSTPSSIIRTERGLTISGTRITLYDVEAAWAKLQAQKAERQAKLEACA